MPCDPKVCLPKILLHIAIVALAGHIALAGFGTAADSSSKSSKDAKTKIWSVSNGAWQSEVLRDLDADYEDEDEDTDKKKHEHRLEDIEVWDYSVGNDGSVHVVGFTTEYVLDEFSKTKREVPGSWDAFVAKYSSLGEVAWQRRHGTSPGIIDDANSVAASSDGSVYAAGFTDGHLASQENSGEQDAFVVKYSRDGIHQWTKLIGTPLQDEARAITRGNNGSIIVAGFTKGDMGEKFGDKDMFVSKLSENGEILWTKVLGTTERDEAVKVAANQHGDVYVVGYTVGVMTSGNLRVNVSGGRGDTFIAKFSDQGELLWVRQELTIGLFHDPQSGLTSAACTGDGSLLLAGYTGKALRVSNSLVTDEVKGAIDAFVVKIGSTGAIMWAKLLGSSEPDKALSVAENHDGTILLAGYTEGVLQGQKHAGYRDAFVAGYSPGGTIAWVTVLGTEDDDEAKIIAPSVDHKSAYHVAGYTHGTFGNATVFGRGHLKEGRLAKEAYPDTYGNDLGYFTGMNSAVGARLRSFLVAACVCMSFGLQTLS